MQVTRMDLDGTGSPTGLAAKILKAEPGLTLPIPIEELARQLDIADIRDLTTEGFEGGLITDDARSAGFILVNRAAHRARRRFTVGHELGHFLMTHHRPPPGEPFQCSRADMRRWSGKDRSAAIKMEVEANEFAALILMPPPIWRREMRQFRDPNLGQVATLAGTFGVSKEAAARAYTSYHDETIAVVVTKDAVVDRIYKSTNFPLLCVKPGNRVPPNSLLLHAPKRLSEPSDVVETRAEAWLESTWGRALPSVYEQVFFQQNGYAMVLLWAEIAEEEEFSDERTARERYRDRQQQWRR